MGLLSGSISMIHYSVAGDCDRLDDLAWLGQQLSRNGFRAIDQTAEEVSQGWVHLSDSQDSDFNQRQDFKRDDYLTFSLRIDRRRVPGALLKQEFEQASEEFLAAKPGMRRVPKAKREELRDQVRLSLLARTLPTPSTYDILWQPSLKRLTLFSLNRQAIEAFETLFTKTFEGLRVVTLTPMQRAQQCVDDALQPALMQANLAQTDAYLEQVEANQWLGWDFLRWLFHATLTTSAEYGVQREGVAPVGARYVAYLNDRLLLTAQGDEGVQKVTIAGPQTIFAEARTALAQGKELQEATVYLERDQDQWRFNLKGDRFHFASMRCPVVKPDVDPVDVEDLAELSEFYARVGAVEEGEQLFDCLLGQFLRERLSDEWPTKDKAIRDWLAGD